jgi:hypothetical protein
MSVVDVIRLDCKNDSANRVSAIDSELVLYAEPDYKARYICAFSSF